MKTSRIVIPLLALAFAGCAAAPQRSSLTNAQATAMAVQLANEKATAIYQCHPFHDGNPATFVNGHWRWTELTRNAYEATVELAANGSTNRVLVNFMYDTSIP